LNQTFDFLHNKRKKQSFQHFCLTPPSPGQQHFLEEWSLVALHLSAHLSTQPSPVRLPHHPLKSLSSKCPHSFLFPFLTWLSKFLTLEHSLRCKTLSELGFRGHMLFSILWQLLSPSLLFHCLISKP
jgi:hypothetical protein